MASCTKSKHTSLITLTSFLSRIYTGRATTQLANHLSVVERWLSDWRIKINKQKCKQMLGLSMRFLRSAIFFIGGPRPFERPITQKPV